MNCYAREYNRKNECISCKLKEYCREAGDPPLISEQNSVFFPAGRFDPHMPDCRNRMRELERDRRYSRADLCEVIGFMASLDSSSLELLNQKLADPSLNISDLAARRGVSRQAMPKMVTARLQRIPELAAIITYRRHRAKAGVSACSSRTPKERPASSRRQA